MNLPLSEQKLISTTVERLGKLLGSEVVLEHEPRIGPNLRADLKATVGNRKFVIEIARSGSTAEVSKAIRVLETFAFTDGKMIPMLVVPFMGEVGRGLCEESDIAWLDLSGNANIRDRDLLIRVSGEPNQFLRRGRPSSLFAPKSSRITRQLLLNTSAAFTQRELAEKTGVDEGHTSRVVRGLEDDGLITRDAEGRVSPQDPSLLLSAWREDYDFSKHDILKGHVPVRSGEELTFTLAERLHDRDTYYAMTGLSGAWLHRAHAIYRTTSLYLHDSPSAELLESISFRKTDRGGNIWFIIPNDKGVFDGCDEQRGVRTVHPVQIYLDLHFHPERAEEAAEDLKLHLWREDRHERINVSI